MRPCSRGFSLVEVLIATTITVAALASLAQMFVLAGAANRSSRTRTLATMLARDKIESLLHESEAVTATDFLDSRGEWLGDTLQPPGTAFVRRWSVTPATGFLDESRLLVVWITSADGTTELVRLVGAREGRAP